MDKDDEDNCEYGWFLRDDKNRFINKNCIKKIGNNTYYISYLTFSPEVRAYINKKAAEEALLTLNKNTEQWDIGVSFHINDLNVPDLIKQNREFKVNNMVIQKINVN
jgi:hypothetical protein